MITMSKKELRNCIRSRYEGDDEKVRQSELLCQAILSSEEYRTAKTIAGYMPMVREADIHQILIDALGRGKILVLPLCGEAPDMTLRRITSMSDLRSGSYGISEPSDDAPEVNPADVDLFLVPLEGIDHEGRRLGKGGGYYDRMLMGVSGVTMGCALSWQWMDNVPTESWDVRLNACADQQGIHYFDKHEDRKDLCR